jgi:hypothetical protein
MKTTVKFLTTIFGLAVLAHFANGQEIYLHDLKPCGILTDTAQAAAQSFPESYLPIYTDPNQVKYIRVAIHFLLPGGIVVIDNLKDCNAAQTTFKYIGLGNFTESGDGYTNSGYNGYLRAEDIINQANAELDDNADQWRKANDPLVQNPPLSITYPSTPPEVKVRYLLTGVYFHRDDSAYYLKKTRDQIHAQYGVNPTTTINVYYTPNGGWSGIANTASGGGVKYVFNNDYLTYVKPACRDWSLIYSASLLNHEIGHTLALQHTWNEDDKCLDTPRGFVYDKWEKQTNGSFVCIQNQNANCWTVDPSTPTCPSSTGGKPCDTPNGLWYKISNNMMDYNQWAPHAVTGCQIGRINNDLAGAGNMFIHSCNGCMPSVAFFQLPEAYHICPPNNGFFLDGAASFNENRWLIDICEVNPSAPDVCIGNNINTGWNMGEVGKVNLLSFYTFQINKHYRIKLVVDNSECSPSSEFSKVIEVKGCIEPEPPNDPNIAFIATNPFDQSLTIYYTVDVPGILQIRLVNVITGAISILLPESEVVAGEYQIMRETASIASGTYSLQFVFNNSLFTQTIVKP